METKKSILHELYVYSEWKQEPEYLQKPNNIIPDQIQALWKWFKYFAPKKTMIDNITVYKEHLGKWQIALGDEGKVIAVLTDNILEIRTKRSDYATIAARTTVIRDGYPQWRRLVWSPDCSFIVISYGNGTVSFYDLTASNLFNIPADCLRPGGLECTDTTHALAGIIFMPLRVKDKKWNWEVLLVTHDGKLRGYLVSQTDSVKLHHTFKFVGGVSAITYSSAHNLLFVAGSPRNSRKDKSSLNFGITAWRILNDSPFYKLSVISDELEAQLATDRFQFYIPLITTKNFAYIINMVVSPDGTKVVCVHCNGDISVWRLPLLKLIYQYPLSCQPEHDYRSPLVDNGRQLNGNKNTLYYPADVNWWSNEELIISRFNGAVTVCGIENMINILGKKPEFFQGTPLVTGAHDGTFIALEFESNVLPVKKSVSDESMELVKVEKDTEDNFYEATKELFKIILYAVTDIEHFQPKPRKITVVSRIYRLLGVKSTTPKELFSRKIESGHYEEALNLADNFDLDKDLVYQQQWRKTPVSTDAIHKYLSKVTKKIWAVHQCVDRLPETLQSANELLEFGLSLTNDEILTEVNKERSENDMIKDPEEITLDDLNAYSSELLRCRHVMLFYKERLKLYDAILQCEKSTYARDEYHCLRTSSVVQSSIELAKEGRIEALTCLWSHTKSAVVQLSILEKLPETVNPLEYKHLLPGYSASPMKTLELLLKRQHDWCRKEIFRSIWSSNWSEDNSPECEQSATDATNEKDDISKWYEKRAREIELYSGIVSHALTLVSVAVERGVAGLDAIHFHLLTLDTLVYDVNIEDINLSLIEKMSVLDICHFLMKKSIPESFVSDLKKYVIPFLKRYENFSKSPDACLNVLSDYLESLSVNDLSTILLVLQSPNEFKLDVRTHLELAEKCLFAYTGTEQLDKARELVDSILKESDGSIAPSELLRRQKILEMLMNTSNVLSYYDVNITITELNDAIAEPKHIQMLLTKMARNASPCAHINHQKCWETLLKDILGLQESIFTSISKSTCYEIYASSLLTSGDATSIKMSNEVLSCEANDTKRANRPVVPYERSIILVLAAAQEYFNSASSLTDPSLELAKCCLSLIKDENALIQDELDLINALPILSAFGLSILPIQVRLCEDRMSLIEECLKIDRNAYLASHKLLKLAKLIKIAGDDEKKREGVVLQLVGECAAKAGAAGANAAAEAARRLAALRHAPASQLLAHVATHTHADRQLRRSLLAAAASYCIADNIEDMLRARLELEIEDVQEDIGDKLYVMEEQYPLSKYMERNESIDDEFADAITTPNIEKKDIVTREKEDKIPILNYLLDTWNNKFLWSNKDNSQKSSESIPDYSVSYQEFYRNLYPEHKVSDMYYSYDRFSLPDTPLECRVPISQSAMKWLYIQNSLNITNTQYLEKEVVMKSAEEMLYRDTAMSVACLLCSASSYEQISKFIDANNTETAISVMLYALLMKYNADDLKDNVFLIKPIQIARLTLNQQSYNEERFEIIKFCLEKLVAMVECNKLKNFGYPVNNLLFNSDVDYRKETIYRLARSNDLEHLDLACSLAGKYKISLIEVWVQRISALLCDGGNLSPGEMLKCLSDERMLKVFRQDKEQAIQCISQEIWVTIRGDNHNILIFYFTLIKNIDEKAVISGLTPIEHVKLLKKLKAASQEINYKVLLKHHNSDEFQSHILCIMKPENVGLVMKFIRSLPSSLKMHTPLNTLFTMWLTKYFFSISPNSITNKKWMQQYRQCASYFSKLSKEDLLEFVKQTCFSRNAIEKVPAGTRNLMICITVDYCQQEQENEVKFNKSESTWGQIGQKLTEWAEFLDKYHSSNVQNIIENSNVDKKKIWPEIEMSRGKLDQIQNAVSKLIIEAGLNPGAYNTLLKCLNIEMDINEIFRNILENYADNPGRMQTLASCIVLYHKENMKLSDELIDSVLKRAGQLNLPPHKQIALLSLTNKNQLNDSDDLIKIVHFTIDLFKNEWPDAEYINELTDEMLMTPEGRREAFLNFLALSNTWQKKKVLVDILNCWPDSIIGSDGQSLRCEYINNLLSIENDVKESLIIIKLLMRKSTLSDEEIKWLASRAQGESVLNALWLMLLSKNDMLKNDIIKLIHSHKETFLKVDMEDDLIKELLDSGLFIKLVPTVVYSSVIKYIVNLEASNASSSLYTIKWATDQLVKNKFIAEAGHLQLMKLSVPNSLRGFSETVLYCKKLFNKN